MSSNIFNFMENLNEAAIYIVCYFTFLFTDWIPDLELRYTLGFVFMPVIVLIVAINIVCVFYDMFKAFSQKYKAKKIKKPE